MTHHTMTHHTMTLHLPLILVGALAIACIGPKKESKPTTTDNDTTPQQQVVYEQEKDTNDTVPTPQKGGSAIQDSVFYSKVLGSNRNYTVYLPPSYHSDTRREYPILYLLHGMLDDNRCWAERAHLQAVTDSLISQGKCCEMIIVTPCAGGKANVDWNGYFDMPGWAYESFFFKEFLPFIESHYRVSKTKGRRAVAGLSMGGGAATSYAQRYLGMFSGCYAMSALMDIVPLPGSKAGKNSKVGLMSTSVAEKSCTKFVQNAKESTVDSLRLVKWYVDCGDKDFLLQRNREFIAAMKAKKIPLSVQIRKGTHSWQYWHSGLFICLPFISDSFAKEQ